MTRFGKLISTETMLCLYRAFFSFLTFVIVLWCGISVSSKQDSDKLDLLNKRIL